MKNFDVTRYWNTLPGFVTGLFVVAFIAGIILMVSRVNEKPEGAKRPSVRAHRR